MNRSFLLLSVLLSCSIQADAVLDVRKPWVRAMPPGVAMTAGYMVLTNRVNEQLTISGVSTSAARHAEIHHTELKQGLSSMRESGDIVLEPGQGLELRPGGTHLMLMGIADRLAEGDMIEVVIQFADDTQQTVGMPVLRKAPGE